MIGVYFYILNPSFVFLALKSIWSVPMLNLNANVPKTKTSNYRRDNNHCEGCGAILMRLE